MASTFHLSTPFSQIHPLKPKPKPSLFHLSKTHLSHNLKPIHPRKFTINSTDISKEEEQQQQQTSPDSEKLRLEEKFAVLNTGIYECRSCGYKYDEGVGDPSYPIPPGYQFEKLPDDWRCPTCGAAQSFFESKSVEIAGFAQNQQYGLGGNSLTSGQKTVLIYGTLLFFFGLFLSGYFIQ
ncbi:unnamed protein product [Lathyrus oleraceus]|uniref:Rubredoxin-like domain-containing protein n=1 Tax=Pisum sativum TaxID=3888 RepID=A0A9D4XPJ5_PEA|nr:uncharacterized protein LOC127132287 [Pisum sativum]KAI5424152.1 hypothetical protein KIW84_030388 [Pisum sativum]